MSGFEFTPAGMMPLGAYSSAQKVGEVATATADVPGPEHSREAHQSYATMTTATFSNPSHLHPSPKPSPIAPKDVIRLAKARLKEVEREIRRIQKLETERDELKRLLDAAAGKPIAIVRSLPTRSAKPA